MMMLIYCNICRNYCACQMCSLNNYVIASWEHYRGVIMGVIASQITILTMVYSTVYSDADQRKDQSSASLACVRGIHRWPANSPYKGPVTRKMLPFDDVIMEWDYLWDGGNMNVLCLLIDWMKNGKLIYNTKHSRIHIHITVITPDVFFSKEWSCITLECG